MMATNMDEQYIEVSESLHRKSPPEMVNAEEIEAWKAVHESSQAGLFSSIFSYPTADPYIGEVISPTCTSTSTKKTTRTKPAKKPSPPLRNSSKNIKSLKPP